MRKLPHVGIFLNLNVKNAARLFLSYFLFRILRNAVRKIAYLIFSPIFKVHYKCRRRIIRVCYNGEQAVAEIIQGQVHTVCHYSGCI